jgi:hypothetical protein
LFDPAGFDRVAFVVQNIWMQIAIAGMTEN